MENREFISAANLPTTETSEVDVLCVEKGELKRKSAASLGGGGYDLKVRLWFEYSEDDGLTAHGELLEGSYEAAKQKIDNGEPAVARIIEDATAYEQDGGMPFMYVGENYLASTVMDGVECLCGYSSSVDFMVQQDNTILIDF